MMEQRLWPMVGGPFKTLEEAVAAALELSKDNHNAKIEIANKDGTTSFLGKA